MTTVRLLCNCFLLDVIVIWYLFISMTAMWPCHVCFMTAKKTCQTCLCDQYTTLSWLCLSQHWSRVMIVFHGRSIMSWVFVWPHRDLVMPVFMITLRPVHGILMTTLPPCHGILMTTLPPCHGYCHDHTTTLPWLFSWPHYDLAIGILMTTLRPCHGYCHDHTTTLPWLFSWPHYDLDMAVLLPTLRPWHGCPFAHTTTL